MAVDKTLEVVYDLASINEEQADKLIKANEQVIKKSQQQSKKNKKKLKELTDKEKETKDSKKRLDELKEKKTKDKEISNLEIAEELGAVPQKGLNFFVSQFKTSLPLIGPILAVSGFFINELLKLDALSKKFLDIADTRINAFVNRQEQARLDNRLDQIIYTTKAGTSAPRDSYNSFNSYDRVLTEDGRDRNASSIGGVD